MATIILDTNNNYVKTQDKVQLLTSRFLKVRQYSETLTAELSEADAQIQAMPDVSPAKWHLAHTTWFFETFILCIYSPEYTRVNESYNYLFNSYYNGIGDQYPRHQRGLISRPSLHEILNYRKQVDGYIVDFLATLNAQHSEEILSLIELGLQHEQQHQELILTDIKYNFFQNPQLPAIQVSPNQTEPTEIDDMKWLPFDPGIVSMGATEDTFSFDNEKPKHKMYLHPYSLASRLVTNGEFLEFIEQGGYQNPEYWLSDGWAWLIKENRVNQSINIKNTADKFDLHPLYWLQKEGQWYSYTLYGLQPLDLHKPLLHVNYYEANAFANWLGCRLPTEFEWEYAVSRSLEDKSMSLSDCFGCGWQWTSSSYAAYPGFVPFTGAAGEYNGKFMSNQYVLKGSSLATPEGHSRPTYRNFFYAHQQWQFTTIRLAK